MGIYQYTLRADTKDVGHLKLGRFGFAYKHSSWPCPALERKMASASYHAENAAWKLREVRHFVVGEWTYAEHPEGLPIFEMEPCPEFTEELRGERIVGVLRKVAGRYRVDPPYGWMVTRNEALA